MRGRLARRTARMIRQMMAAVMTAVSATSVPVEIVMLRLGGMGVHLPGA